MATDTESNGRMTGASRYVEVNYNPTEIIPDAAPGKYGVVISKVYAKPHRQYGYPQIVFVNTIESEESGIEANEQFIGSEISKSVTLYPDKRGNKGKQDLQALCKIVGVDLASFPLTISNPEVDLRDFMDSFKGQRINPAYVTQSESPDLNDPNVMRTNSWIDYEEPRNFAAQIGQAETVEEEPEEERPAPRRPAARAPAKPAKKGASARR